jgi:serine/alanine adding enzyme
MSYQVVTEINHENRKSWSEFVNKHPDGTIFQSPSFNELFSGNDTSCQVFLGVEDEKSRPCGLVFAITMNEIAWPKKHFATRTIIYGGPLLDPEATNPGVILGLLLDALVIKVKGSSLYIEFRNFRDISEYREVFKLHGFKYREHLNLIIDTTDLDNVQSGISKSKLRQIRKSIALGAEIKPAETTSEFEEFYALLKKLYRVKVRKPVPPIDLFRKFFAETLKGNLGVILVVKYKGHVVAGMVCPITPGKVLHEWYVCGADSEYKEIFPSVLITWAGIEYTLLNKIPFFDFMGMGQPEQEYGVRHFKTRFGGEKVNYGRFIRINNSLKYSIAKTGLYALSLFRG